MAISPQEARSKLIDRESQDIQQAESRIDTALAEGRRDVMLPKLSPAGLGELKSRYERAGWSVQLISDPRDGSFWHFSEITTLYFR